MSNKEYTQDNIDDDYYLDFGKFRDWRLGDVDPDYLLWVWDEFGYKEDHILHKYLKSAYDDMAKHSDKVSKRDRDGNLIKLQKQ
jgi:hypothetical protein